MSTSFINKTPVNQLIYTYDGFWTNPDGDKKEVIHYYISEHLSVKMMNDDYQHDKGTVTIIVGGDYPMMLGDTITLDNGNEFVIVEMTRNQMPVNRMMRDLLKPQIRDITLKLE